MGKHQPKHLKLVILSQNVQTSTITPQIDYLVSKYANINNSTSNWLFGPKMGKHQP